MRTTLPPALSPPATPHFGFPLNSPMSLEIANIQQFFTQKNSNFMKLNLTELSMIPSPITIRHSMSVHLIDANICPLLQWQPTPVLLPRQSHGWRSLVGCSPWGREESDTTEQLHFHFSPSCIGEGNGNPLQCSCLENPRDGGAWWVAIYGVSQSRTQLSDFTSPIEILAWLVTNSSAPSTGQK